MFVLVCVIDTRVVILITCLFIFVLVGRTFACGGDLSVMVLLLVFGVTQYLGFGSYVFRCLLV